MLFSEIPGLEAIKKQLIQSVKDDHIAHAQLFLCKGGGANLPLALAFINYLNCEQPGENDACGQCSSCMKNSKFIHSDLHFVYPLSSTKNITGKDVISTNFIKDWRSFLLKNPFGDVNSWAERFGGENKQLNISKEESRQIIKNLSLKAFEGKFKVMLIWLPEYMHTAAANGILKILEEPPAGTLFILVCNDEEKLLTTILSRTQIVKIRRMNDGEMITLLTKNQNVDESAAAKVARIADGDISEAIALLEGVEDDGHAFFKEWMRMCFQRDFAKMVEQAEMYHKMSKISQRSLLQYGLNIMRESLLSTAEAGDLHRLADEEVGFVENFSKVMSIEKLEKISTMINDALYHLERNASAKITFLDLSLQIAKSIK